MMGVFLAGALAPADPELPKNPPTVTEPKSVSELPNPNNNVVPELKSKRLKSQAENPDVPHGEKTKLMAPPVGDTADFYVTSKADLRRIDAEISGLEKTNAPAETIKSLRDQRRSIDDELNNLSRMPPVALPDTKDTITRSITGLGERVMEIQKSAGR